MTEEQILKSFKEAEKFFDNERPKCKGLCCFFCNYLKVSHYNIDYVLQPLWLKYSERKENLYHFENRQERLEAIRKVIQDLEKSC